MKEAERVRALAPGRTYVQYWFYYPDSARSRSACGIRGPRRTVC